jgi:hypothetical protein
MDIAIALVFVVVSIQMLVFLWMWVFKGDKEVSIQQAYLQSWKWVGDAWTFSFAPVFARKK